MKNDLSFEDKMLKLEELVSIMHSENLPLQKAMECFEEGTQLIKQLNTEINDVEDKITILVKQSEEFIEKPYMVDGDCE